MFHSVEIEQRIPKRGGSTNPGCVVVPTGADTSIVALPHCEMLPYMTIAYSRLRWGPVPPCEETDQAINESGTWCGLHAGLVVACLYAGWHYQVR